MDRRGYLLKNEKEFIKQGVMFNHIKLAVFGMRPDELRERMYFIKSGQYDKLRPSSGQSRISRVSLEHTSRERSQQPIIKQMNLSNLETLEPKKMEV